MMADEPKVVTPETVQNPPPVTVIDPTTEEKKVPVEEKKDPGLDQKVEPDHHHERH